METSDYFSEIIWSSYILCTRIWHFCATYVEGFVYRLKHMVSSYFAWITTGATWEQEILKLSGTPDFTNSLHMHYWIWRSYYYAYRLMTGLFAWISLTALPWNICTNLVSRCGTPVWIIFVYCCYFLFMTYITGGHGKTALCATWLPASPYLLCLCIYVFVLANVMVIANKHSFIHSFIHIIHYFTHAISLLVTHPFHNCWTTIFPQILKTSSDRFQTNHVLTSVYHNLLVLQCRIFVYQQDDHQPQESFHSCQKLSVYIR